MANIDVSKVALSLTDAITLTKRRFLVDNSGRRIPTAAYQTVAVDYENAQQKWPALMMVAAVVYTLQNDAGNAVNTTNVIAALGALHAEDYPNG